MMIKQENQLHFLNAVYNNGQLWFNSIGWNGYYRMNIKTGNIKFLGRFDYVDRSSDKLFYRVLAYQQYIFFIPWFFDYLVRLNTATLEMKYWKVPDEFVMEIAKFRAAYIYQEKIVMFPMFGNVICIFDIKTSEFICDTSWKQKEWKINGDFMQGCQLEKEMYVPILTNPLVLKYNFINKKHNLIVFPQKEKGIVKTVVYNNQELLVLSWNGNIWKHNVMSNKNEIFYEYSGNKDCPYSNLVVHEGEICLLPAHEENIHILSDGKIYTLSYPVGWKMISNHFGIDWYMTDCHLVKDYILLYPVLGNMLLILDTKTKTLSGIKLSNRLGLNFFLNNLEEDDKQKEQKQKTKGFQIWENMIL